MGIASWSALTPHQMFPVIITITYCHYYYPGLAESMMAFEGTRGGAFGPIWPKQGLLTMCGY